MGLAALVHLELEAGMKAPAQATPSSRAAPRLESQHLRGSASNRSGRARDLVGTRRRDGQPLGEAEPRAGTDCEAVRVASREAT